MQISSVTDYIHPAMGAPLEIVSVEREDAGKIIEGFLRETGQGQKVVVRNSIPRFVSGQNYADNFGFQWNRYRQVQLDSLNSSTLTRDRFYQGTGWRAEELKGKRVLEVGCGAGRFSEILLAAGAQLYSFDYSEAVDAGWINLHQNPTWNLCQADIYAMPYRQNWFDYIFCYGVIQHTPDPKKAFLNLVRYLKPEGQIAIDVYHRPIPITKLGVKYWYRPFAKRISYQLLARTLEWYLPRWIPIDSFLQRVPIVGLFLSAIVPCWNKSDLPISRQLQIEWTILDTFDALTAKYDYPQTLKTVKAWFEEACLVGVGVRLGGNGILGNARKASLGSTS